MRKIALFVTLVILILFSCDITDSPDYCLECRSNCYSVKIEGDVYDTITKRGIESCQLSLIWSDLDRFMGSSLLIKKLVTDSLGHFEFIGLIDTSHFSDGYELYLELQKDDEYYNTFQNNYHVKNISELNQSFDFPTYLKTILRIVTHRISKDTIDYFQISHSFSPRPEFIDYSALYRDLKDTILYKETAPDIPTTITWIKRRNDIITKYRDTIIAQKHTINTFEIRY